MYTRRSAGSALAHYQFVFICKIYWRLSLGDRYLSACQFTSVNSDLCVPLMPPIVGQFWITLSYVCRKWRSPGAWSEQSSSSSVWKALWWSCQHSALSSRGPSSFLCQMYVKYATRTSTSVVGLFSYNSTVNTSVRQFMQHFMQIMVSFAGSVRRNFLPDKRHDSKHI